MNEFYEMNVVEAELREAHNAVPPSNSTGGLKTQEFPAEGRDWKPRVQRTILHVDDNPKALRMLTFVLEGCGYKVVTAGTSAEALARIERASFDIVLLAHRVSQMIGSKLTLEIKRLAPSVPIILLSRHTLLAPQELTDVDAYVGGGATLDNLLIKIQALIGART